MVVYNLSTYTQWLGSLIIFLGCLPLLQNRPTYIKILFSYSVGSILFQLAQNVASDFLKSEYVNEIGNVFTAFEAIMFALLYYHVTGSKKFRRGVQVLLLGYLVFYTAVYGANLPGVNSLIRFGRDFTLILFSLSYFYYLIRKLPEENLLKFSMFWINAAVIFFFSGTLILSFMRDYIVQVLNNDMTGFWAFRNFFRFAFCLVLSYAAILNLRTIRINKMNK